MTAHPPTPGEDDGAERPAPAGGPRDWGGPAGAAPPDWTRGAGAVPAADDGTGQAQAPASGGAAPDGEQPGIVPLRPLTLGEIYDGAFRAIRANPRVLFTFAAAVVAVVGVLQALAAWRARAVVADLEGWVDATDVPDPSGEVNVLLAQAVTSTLAQVLAWVATTVLTGLLVGTVHAAVLGTTPTVREAWDRVRPQVARLLGLALTVVVVVAAVAAAPALVLGTLGALAGGAWAVGGIAVGLVLALVALAFVVPRTVLATPALVVEDLGVGAALARAWRLARGSSGRVLGVLLLTWILVGVANGIITYPLTLLGGAVDPSGLGWAYAFGTVGSILASAVTTPVAAAVTSLLYLDLRVRREGPASVVG